ncbi:hypothetical protein V8C35DRAFT_319019 [Trichoderma chlorosporum]
MTDTESVGPLIIQAAVVDSRRNVVFSGYINHGCSTVADLWDLATKRCGGKLNSFQAGSLRKAFNSPSSQKPKGHSIEWLREQWLALKQQAPSMTIAEWSAHPHDELMYRRSLAEAGFDPDEVLPPHSSWVSPMNWFRVTKPSLAGHSLGYVACLFCPSSLVWRKVHEGKLLLPPADISIARLFSQKEGSEALNSLRVCRWLTDEETLCCAHIEDELEKSPFSPQWEILCAVSYRLLKDGYFRSACSIDTHLRAVMDASSACYGVEISVASIAEFPQDL